MEERRVRATSGDVGIQRTPVDAVPGERGHCKSYILDGDAVCRSAICVSGVVEGTTGDDGEVVRPRNGGSNVWTIAARSDRPDSIQSYSASRIRGRGIKLGGETTGDRLHYDGVSTGHAEGR